ncbi:Hypothetical predicted protein, partial [Pelobates cultripes]
SRLTTIDLYEAPPEPSYCSPRRPPANTTSPTYLRRRQPNRHAAAKAAHPPTPRQHKSG